MAASAAEICNLALVRVGQRGGPFLSDPNLNETSSHAQVCKQVYGPSRDALLAEFPWRWARVRADLAVIEDAERPDWGYVFALPVDFVQPSPEGIWNGWSPSAFTSPEDAAFFNAGLLFHGGKVAYDIEYDADEEARVLLTNVEEVSLSYVSSDIPVARYPALFVDALAWRVATELALGWPEKTDLAAKCEQKWRGLLLQAGAADLRAAREMPTPRSSILTARE